MDASWFQDPSWYQALTVAERLASLADFPDSATAVAVDAEKTSRRLERWRGQAPFATGTYFAQRLAREGICAEQLGRLLGEPITALQARVRKTPSWLAGLARAWSRPPASEPLPLPESLRDHETAGFLAAIEPLLAQARDRLRDGIILLARSCARLPFDPATVVDVLFASLPERLLGMVTATMTLELNVARLQGLLTGDTPQERFRTFLERLRRPDQALALLQEYPVLARQVQQRIDGWAAFSLEFLQHLCADWDDLRTTITSGDDPGQLVQVDGGRGDPHRGNRSVLIAHFRPSHGEKGQAFRLVYKPRSLVVDVHFQELLAWLNARGIQLPFRLLKILDRDSHGWAEFVQATECASLEEVKRFYTRQGGYLALLYALEATDFHFENLIAVGDQPVLIDLEALFHPRAKEPDNVQDDLAGQAMTNSVLRVGLLPQPLWTYGAPEGFDLSGLGAVSGQLTPEPVPTWDDVGTDAMRLIRKRQALHGGQHRPSLAGSEIDPRNHVEDIVAGFADVYHKLCQGREELLAPAGHLARFAHDEVRVIMRGTQTYATLLQGSFHPNLLRDALDRDRFFDRFWIEVKNRPELERIVLAERDDLLRGDIPVFSTRPDSRDLWTSTYQRLAEFFDESGLAQARRRLQDLGDEDFRQQLWFIRTFLAAQGKGMPKPAAPNPVGRIAKPSYQDFVLAARAVGDHLEAQALRTAQEVGWIGMTALVQQRQWALLPLGMSLYEGVPGLALFLAYLGAVTGEERYTNLAQGALANMRQQVKRGLPALGIGGFDGWGGLIYTYSHLATLWQQPELLREAEALVALLPPLIEQDEQLDIIAGSAGCIGGLLSLQRCAPSPSTLAAAIQCGDHLLARATTMEQGSAWVTPTPAVKPLAGFAHGAAGMAWALGKLAVLTGAERFRQAAQAAMAYERSLFSVEAGNWPDLRNRTALGLPEGPANFPVAWCHGAPGIGLARLHSRTHLGDGQMDAEIDAALGTTLAQGFGDTGSIDNHSLCHGDLGNLDLLVEASQILAEPRWQAEVNRRGAGILDSISRNGWLCGVPSRIGAPGLMTGWAGIGYELLRLAEPARVPSVLVLAAPLLSNREENANSADNLGRAWHANRS